MNAGERAPLKLLIRWFRVRAPGAPPLTRDFTNSPKYWSIPDGGMEPGESVREAAVREVKEETGMDCEITSLVGIYSNPRHVAAYDDGEVRQEFSVCLAGRLLGGSIQTSNESSEVRFVPADDIPAYEIHPSIRMRISHYLENRTDPYIS